MATTEARAALHQRLSTALEEALGEALVWRQEDVATCREHGKWAEDEVIVDSGLRCPVCSRTVSWDVQRSPVAWDDPAILWPRWARWVEEDNAGYAVWLGYAPAPDHPTWIAFIQFSMAQPADVPLAQADGPSPTAALASAWDALLSAQKEVRYGGE